MGIRAELAALAAVLACWASPVAALDQAQADCVANAMPDDEEARLAEAMISADTTDEVRDRLQSRFKFFVDGCVQSTSVPDSSVEPYFTFQLARVASQALSRLLGASGIPTDALDTVMDLGPGRSNPQIDQVSDAEVERIVAALDARGVDTGAVDTRRWEQVGGYLAARSLMFNTLNELP